MEKKYPIGDCLTRDALEIELWNMLPNNCRKALEPLKDTYIQSLMADIDSYCAGKQAPTGLPPLPEPILTDDDVKAWEESKLTPEQIAERKEAIKWYRGAGGSAINPDELWDEFSEATDYGTIVMKKEGFKRMMEKLKQSNR